MKDFNALFNQYSCNLNDEKVKEEVAKLLSDKVKENCTKEVYRTCFSLIDLTSLHTTDGEESIRKFVDKVNAFPSEFSEMPEVAAICIYPVFAKTVKEHLQRPLTIAAVSAGFPSSQTFTEVKIAETSLAVSDGASEIDVVIPVGRLLEEEYEYMFEELSELKAACRNAHLKVILETGALASAENIKKASVIALAAGADFIKTSTGKISPAATVEAAYVMCGALKEFHKKNGTKVGFKPAGGISTPEEAVKYYTIVKEVLGEEWLNPKLFRFGTSRLANNLLTAIYGKEITYF
jgi:deoxyribose-phosphate aldolase